MSDKRPFFFIVNPHAGIGWRRFTGVAERMKDLGIPYRAAATTGPGDAGALARMACKEDFRAIVCLGGDGTLNEIVNGFATEDGGIDERVVLGLIPSGTAQDFARSIKVPLSRQRAVDRLLEGKERPIDVGRIRFPDGRVHFFVNVAGAGFDAEVAVRAAEVRGPGMASFPAHVLGFANALAGYHNKEITIDFEDEPGPPSPQLRCSLVVVANGPSYAGMFQLAPKACPDDGLLNVVVIGDVAPFELLWNIPRVMAGTHLTHEKVQTRQCTALSLVSSDGALVQADGDVIGRLPARIDVMPNALRLIR